VADQKCRPVASLLLAFILAASTSAVAQERVLRVISDRTDQGVVRPILEAFEARSGAKVEGVFMDQGLVTGSNRDPPRPTW
jgi:iron(III) transport system substrate-binding protein